MCQIREAHDCIPLSLMKQIYQAEHQALSTFFTNSKQPAGLALMIVWKTMNYNYIRYVDCGALSGFCESQFGSWSANCISDTIATSTDINRLGALQRKRRVKEVDKIFDCVSSLSMPQYSKLSVCLLLVENNGEQIRHISHGTCFEGETFVSQCQQHILQSSVQIDHMQRLRDIVSVSALSLSFQQQLVAINCLPAVNVSFNSTTCTSRYSIAEGRIRTSCKYLFVRDDYTDINAIHTAGALAVAFRKRGSSRKGAITTIGGDAHDYDCDCCDMSDNHVSIGKRTVLTVPVVEKFKFSLQREGLLRVIQKNDLEVDIIWNKFDTVKCKYICVEFEISN